MGTFRLVNSRSEPLTRELASVFRDLKPSPTERELNPARMRHLKQKAEGGLLVTFHWATAALGGEVVRVNGQHSSNVLCGLNGEFPEGLFVHVDEYTVDDHEGLALLFRQFDDRKSGRSATDVSGAYQMLFPELHKVPRALGKLGVEGIAWYRRTVEKVPAKETPSAKGDDVYRIFLDEVHHPFLLWLGEVFSVKAPEMRRDGIVAAMYATFIRNGDEARKFWSTVALSGELFDEFAPTTALSNWLKAAKVEEKKGGFRAAQLYQGSVYCWNAYREEKSIRNVRHDTSKTWYAASE